MSLMREGNSADMPDLAKSEDSAVLMGV